MNPALRRYTMSNSVMHSNYVTKIFDFYSGMQHIHVRMHTPNTVSALGPLFSRTEKQMARLLLGMYKLPGSEPP